MPSYIATLEGIGAYDDAGSFVGGGHRAPLVMGMAHAERQMRAAIRTVGAADKQLSRTADPRARQVLMSHRVAAAAAAIKHAVRVGSGRRAVGRLAGLESAELEAGGSFSLNTATGMAVQGQAILNDPTAAASSWVKAQVATATTAGQKGDLSAMKSALAKAAAIEKAAAAAKIATTFRGWTKPRPKPIGMTRKPPAKKGGGLLALLLLAGAAIGLG